MTKNSNNFYVGPADQPTSNLFGPSNYHSFFLLLPPVTKGGNLYSQHGYWDFFLQLFSIKIKTCNVKINKGLSKSHKIL